MKTLFILLVVSAAASTAHAFDDAKVLPPKVFRVKLVNVETNSFGNKFNNQGNAQSYVANLNRTLDTKAIAARDPRLGKLVQLLDTSMPGASENLVSAQINTEFNSSIQSTVPALEYGINENFAIGLRIPIIQRKVNAQFSASGANNMGALAAKLPDGHPMKPTLTQLGAMPINTQTVAQYIFTNYGYQVPSSFETTELGDIEFGGKYKFYEDVYFRSAILAGIRAPTGSTGELSNIFDTGSGNGNWAFGVQGFQDFKLTSQLTLGGNAMVHYYLPDTRERAVPKNSLDTLPSLKPEDGQVQQVERQMAPKFDLYTYARLEFWNKRLNTWTGYNYAAKAEDDFTGPKVDQLAYSELEKNSRFERHNAELGIGYSSLNDFKNGNTKWPMEVTTVYSQTMAGQNVPKLNYVRLDLDIYF